MKGSVSTVQENSPGLVIYLQQEGRGIGLANKIHAYRLQEVDGLDTVRGVIVLYRALPPDILKGEPLCSA